MLIKLDSGLLSSVGFLPQHSHLTDLITSCIHGGTGSHIVRRKTKLFVVAVVTVIMIYCFIVVSVFGQ